MLSFSLADAVARGHGTERSFICPVHEDSRPSASLNMIKQVWYCYTCGARGSLTGEALLAEPDYNMLKRWLSEKLEEHRVYPESWLSRWDAGPVHPYWQRRVGERAARRFRLGSDPESESVTYPLLGRASEVLGVVRRNLVEGGAKYKYPRGVDIGQLLFNYTPEHRRAVVLVEGALDAIAWWNAGVEAFAIYGARLSTTQINLIDRVDPQYVFTAFDNDDAGYRAHKQVEDAFRHRLVNRVTWPASWGKDVDEIGLDHLQRITPPELVQPQLTCIGSSTWTTNSKTPSSTTSTPRTTCSVRNSSLRIARTS